MFGTVLFLKLFLITCVFLDTCASILVLRMSYDPPCGFGGRPGTSRRRWQRAPTYLKVTLAYWKCARHTSNFLLPMMSVHPGGSSRAAGSMCLQSTLGSLQSRQTGWQRKQPAAHEKIPDALPKEQMRGFQQALARTRVFRCSGKKNSNLRDRGLIECGPSLFVLGVESRSVSK